MKRELKFRAWDKRTKTMFYNQDGYQDGRFILFSINFNLSGVRFCNVGIEDDDGSDRTSMTLVDNYELMQFIGLTDKNGKEAYEGDIVNGRYLVQRSLDPNAEPEIVYFEGVIEYAEGCFYVKSKNGSCVFSFTYPDYEMEIFGNIYENPELL